MDEEIEHYTTRGEAIERGIIEPIEASGVVQNARATFDIDAIADASIDCDDRGYFNSVDTDQFWQIVADHDRSEPDYNGELFTVPADADTGWTEVTWVGDGVDQSVIAYLHAGGTVLVPADCHAAQDESVRDGVALAAGRWYDIRTGEYGLVINGVPALGPFRATADR